MTKEYTDVAYITDNNGNVTSVMKRRIGVKQAKTELTDEEYKKLFMKGD